MLSIQNLAFIIMPTFFTVPVVSSCDNLTIPLNKTLRYPEQLYGEFIFINRSSCIQINFSDINKNISFIVFQAHSHINNIEIYKNVITTETYIHGTNAGLYSSADTLLTDVYYIKNSNENIDLKIYVAIHGYRHKAPIPGGCNTVNYLSISQYVYHTYNKDYILIQAPCARNPIDPECLKNPNVTHEIYMMYLSEMNFNEDVYFDGIKNMMKLESIRANAKLLPSIILDTQTMVSAYRGTGAIYVAIAKLEVSNNHRGYSLYAPSYTYACDPLTQGDCDLIEDLLSNVLCATLFFTGLFICYFGHCFFKTEMFLVGFVSGFLITYIIISLNAVLDQSALISAASLSGVFFGAIWLMFWWFYGIPVLAVLLSCLNVGFLLSCILYYRLPSSITIFQSDLDFWSVFVATAILTGIALAPLTYLANMACCALLGAFATVFSLDFYIGSNLRYILVNTFRRAIVPDFTRVLLVPPFQQGDQLLTGLWVSLASTGLAFQFYYNRGRPPFPPPPRSIRSVVPSSGLFPDARLNVGYSEETPDETTPLLV